MSNLISRMVYLVTYQGPEWNEPVVCMSDKAMADAHVANLNRCKEKLGLDFKRPFPELSTYVVTPIAMTEEAR